MGEVLVFDAMRSIRFEHYPERELKEDEVRLRTLYSGISAGTQLTAYRGTNPMSGKTRDLQSGLFLPRSEGSSMYPIVGGWAYEEIGQVVEMGKNVNGVQIGDRIYGTWGHRSTHIVTESFAIQHKLPSGLAPINGIYSQMGAIALNAVLDANLHLGERVAIFGQGVPGQIAAQLARLNGARVLAIDPDEWRLEQSRKFGAEHTVNNGSLDVGKAVREICGENGADVAIEFSGFTPALHQAIRSVVYNGRVVAAGFYQGEARGLYLGEEFHHNRIQLICSQIGNVSAELTNRWNRLRMEQTIFELASAGRLNLEGLITHVVPFKEAENVYRMLDHRTESSLQVVLAFEE